MKNIVLYGIMLVYNFALLAGTAILVNKYDWSPATFILTLFLLAVRLKIWCTL